MASTPTALDQIKRPVYRTADVKDQVERLDPSRHAPTVEYEFSNGRRFKRRAGEYDSLNLGVDYLTFGDIEITFGTDRLTLGDASTSSVTFGGEGVQFGGEDITWQGA